MTLDEFIEADFEEGWLYELARGVVDVTEVPGLNHGRIVHRIARLFIHYDDAHPGVINYRAGGGECRMRLPGMQSDRHPDQAIYLVPPPARPQPWTRWVPHIVVEVVSEGGEERDYVEKREEYLRIGVPEYWILDPNSAGCSSCNAPATSGKRSSCPPARSTGPTSCPAWRSAPRSCSGRRREYERQYRVRLDSEPAASYATSVAVVRRVSPNGSSARRFRNTMEISVFLG